MADRPTNDFVNKSVHRGGPLLSIGDKPGEAVAKAVPLKEIGKCLDLGQGAQYCSNRQVCTCRKRAQFETRAARAERRAFASNRRALAIAKSFVEPVEQVPRGLGDDGAGRE